MKKVFHSFLILALCFGSFASFAQDSRPDPAEKAKKMSDKMKTELSLSEDQYKKVYDLNLKYAEKMKSLRGTESERKEKRNSYRELNEEKTTELKTILNAEQITKYEQWQKEKKEHMKSRGHKGRHDKDEQPSN